MSDSPNGNEPEPADPEVRELAALGYLVVICEALGIEPDEEWDRFMYARAIHRRVAPGVFTADEIVQIANETSDSLGNLYRLDFIDRVRHEAGRVGAA